MRTLFTNEKMNYEKLATAVMDFSAEFSFENKPASIDYRPINT